MLSRSAVKQTPSNKPQLLSERGHNRGTAAFAITGVNVRKPFIITPHDFPTLFKRPAKANSFQHFNIMYIIFSKYRNTGSAFRQRPVNNEYKLQISYLQENTPIAVLTLSFIAASAVFVSSVKSGLACFSSESAAFTASAPDLSM